MIERREALENLYLNLPLPKGKGAYRRSNNGYVLKRCAFMDIKKQWTSIFRCHKDLKINGRYEVRYYATRPDNRNDGIDNLWKPVSDILQNNGIIDDDSNCVRYSGEWIDTIKANPSISIWIRRVI